MIPVVVGMKLTARGAVPLVWLAVKFTDGEAGTCAFTSLEYLLSEVRVES